MFYLCIFSILGNQFDINEQYYLTTAASGTFLKKNSKQIVWYYNLNFPLFSRGSLLELLNRKSKPLSSDN